MKGPDPYSGIIDIALVNNMPDQALAATDMQFARLVSAGARGRVFRLRRYFLPSVTRGETAKRYLAREYEQIGALYHRGADALIVTGAEPHAANFEDEPYWSELTRLVDWARVETVSTIWSCLAAHAAVYHLDGVTRQRRASKLSGVFAFTETAQHWARPSQRRKLLTPHSRYNELAAQDLTCRGYALSSIGEAGVDSFWRREPSLFLFLQGHPEYEAESLLKEYRRDVLRYVAGERSDYPDAPSSIFSEDICERLEALRATTRGGSADHIASRLGDILSASKCQASWASHAARLYHDWLALVARESGAAQLESLKISAGAL